MELREVMRTLEQMGTEQNRKVYPRHGVKSPMFGVSFANIDKLAKQIKRDQALAEALWDTGNHDARMLAGKIADATKISPSTIDRWIRDVDNYVLGQAIAPVLYASEHAEGRMRAWIRSKDEWAGMVGWLLLTYAAMQEPELDDAFFEPFLELIETGIHRQANRVRYEMNNALIAIGARNLALRARALAIARKIGTVEVDHGETGCKTPDASSYIAKMAARQSARAKRG